MQYRWEKIIGSIVYGRARAAARVGLSLDELMSEGRLAAEEATLTWSPQGGRGLDSWIWMKVHFSITNALIQAGKYLVEDPLHPQDSPGRVAHLAGEEQETVAMVRQALGYLQASLPNLDWAMLWLRHAEGRKFSEIGEIMGMTTGAVQRKIHRVRGQAVSILEERGIAPVDTIHV